MIDQLFMKDLAYDLAPPLETEQPATLLASGPATSDVGQVTVQGYDPSRDTAGGAFVGTRLNTPKAGQAQPTLQDREKLAIGLLDTLAGALRGAAIETVALPGNIRSIVDMINKEGAEKYFGQAVAPTTEDIKKAEGFTLFGQDIPVPPVLGADVPNRAERQKSVEAAEEVGAYLPAPGVPEAVVQGAKLLTKAVKATKGLPVGNSIKDVTGSEVIIPKAPKIETKAFKSWFGESKAIDDSNKPIVLYHGAATWDDEIKNDRYRTGKFFTSSPKVAERFGKTLIPVYLKTEKPYIVDANGSFYASIDTPKEMKGWATTSEVDTDLIAEYALKHGYDSVIIKNVLEGNGSPEVADDFVVFSPSQIKSAIGNKGTFDPNNPSILYGAGAGAVATQQEDNK